MEGTHRLSGKDLIQVGIYTAMTLVTYFVIGMFNAFPVLYPVAFAVWPIACGIPMMLYYTKITSFGMLTISGLIFGLFFFLIGYTWIALVWWTLGGLLADIVFRIGGYGSLRATMLSYACFCLGMMGCPAPLWLAGQAYWDTIQDSMGPQFVADLRQIMPPWLLFVGLAVLFVCGMLGALFGHRMLKKHFERAGIA